MSIIYAILKRILWGGAKAAVSDLHEGYKARRKLRRIAHGKLTAGMALEEAEAEAIGRGPANLNLFAGVIGITGLLPIYLYIAAWLNIPGADETAAKIIDAFTDTAFGWDYAHVASGIVLSVFPAIAWKMSK